MIVISKKKNFDEKKKKKLSGAVIVPAHLNPNLTWHEVHLDNNGVYHYSNP
jgi:hypothetical protein